MFEQNLESMLPEQRCRIWMGRIEAEIFASALAVGREPLARLSGQKVSAGVLIEDILAELSSRPYDLVDGAGIYAINKALQHPFQNSSID